MLYNIFQFNFCEYQESKNNNKKNLYSNENIERRSINKNKKNKFDDNMLAHKQHLRQLE